MKSQTLGEKLKALRESHHYTLKYVGERAGYDPRLLSKVEKNKKKAPQDMLRALSGIYKVPFRELMLKYLSENIYYQLRTSADADEILAIVEKRLKEEGRGTQFIKSREEIFESIRNYFSDKPVEKAYVFGSFARNAPVSMDSDIDILLVFKKPHKITLFDLIQMKEELSEKTGRNIDLVEEGREIDSIKKSIQDEKILIYAS